MIHLAIAFDQNYLQQFYTLLTSILKNTRKGKLYFHFIAPDLSDVEKERVQRYIYSQHAESSFYSLDDVLIRDLVLTGKWTQAVYFRLLFPLLVSPNVERILYLDCDTLAIGDLNELFDIDLGHYPVGAVYDIYVKGQPLIGIREGDYFNSGVLLIDVKKWREQGVSEKTLAYLRMNPDHILYVDQCGLNAVLKGNWKKLNYRFNVLYSYLPHDVSLTALKDFISDKVIVHYTMQRPWNFLCKNRLRFLYWQYLGMSPLSIKTTNMFDDFTFLKIPAWIIIRITESYFDSPTVQKFWRMIKGSA